MVITFKCQFSERKLDIILNSIRGFTTGSFTFKKGIQIKWTESKLMHCTHIHVESQLKDWKIGTGSISVFAGWFKNKNRKRERCYLFQKLTEFG